MLKDILTCIKSCSKFCQMVLVFFCPKGVNVETARTNFISPKFYVQAQNFKTEGHIFIGSMCPWILSFSA